MEEKWEKALTRFMSKEGFYFCAVCEEWMMLEYHRNSHLEVLEMLIDSLG